MNSICSVSRFNHYTYPYCSSPSPFFSTLTPSLLPFHQLVYETVHQSASRYLSSSASNLLKLFPPRWINTLRLTEADILGPNRNTTESLSKASLIFQTIMKSYRDDPSQDETNTASKFEQSYFTTVRAIYENNPPLFPRNFAIFQTLIDFFASCFYDGQSMIHPGSIKGVTDFFTFLAKEVDPLSSSFYDLHTTTDQELIAQRISELIVKYFNWIAKNDPNFFKIILENIFKIYQKKLATSSSYYNPRPFSLKLTLEELKRLIPALQESLTSQELLVNAFSKNLILNFQDSLRRQHIPYENMNDFHPLTIFFQFCVAFCFTNLPNNPFMEILVALMSSSIYSLKFVREASEKNFAEPLKKEQIEALEWSLPYFSYSDEASLNALLNVLEQILNRKGDIEYLSIFDIAFAHLAKCLTKSKLEQSLETFMRLAEVLQKTHLKKYFSEKIIALQRVDEKKQHLLF